MNAADDKQKKFSNRLNDNILASNSVGALCAETEKGLPQSTQNGSLSCNHDCNKYSITNGAYPKTKPVSNSSSPCENGGPSGLKKSNFPKNDTSENNCVEANCQESDKNKAPNTEDDNVQKLCKPKESVTCDYDRYSSSEDEECCIYTYKGDSNQMADLPSSFFRLDLMPSRPNANSRNSSPDMDYLEMDFDPGPSNGRYSSSGSECGDDTQGDRHFSLNLPFLPKPTSNNELSSEVGANPPSPLSPLSTPSPVRPPEQPQRAVWSPPPSPSSPPVVQRTTRDMLQPSYCYCVVNKVSPLNIDENFNDGEGDTMIWKEDEAKEKQVTQSTASNCGATAVINALLGLDIQFSVNEVQQIVGSRLRQNTAPLPEYLMSRCDAGASHIDMIRGLEEVSQNSVYARFFHMFPRRNISLTNWLSHWIRKGAVPIVTRNLQRGVSLGSEVPDVWHHQMVYGVSLHGIHLTNKWKVGDPNSDPLECVSEACLWQQVSSPSVLLVQRDDILSRWTPDTPLHSLIHPTRPLWRKMNVLGQVVNMIREHSVGSRCTQHITIPASYSSGVILAILESNPACQELRSAPELPVDPFSLS